MGWSEGKDRRARGKKDGSSSGGTRRKSFSFFAPLPRDFIASILFSLSPLFSLNYPPLEGIRARRQPTTELERDKGQLILGLDSGSASNRLSRCAPSIHPSSLHSPVFSLRAPNHSARFPRPNPPPKRLGVLPQPRDLTRPG